jgi:hypothetical protein
MAHARLTSRRGKQIKKANHGKRGHQRRRRRLSKGQWK